MIWPFKRRSTHEPCFSIGQYRIDDPIDHIDGLIPLSPAELTALNTTVKFEAEQIWHAPGAEFMDLKWDTILGTVHGSIYKIAIQLVGPRHHTGNIYRRILIRCTERYGKGQDQTLWDASDGNIVVDSRSFGDQGILNVFVTSRRIRQFQRI